MRACAYQERANSSHELGLPRGPCSVLMSIAERRNRIMTPTESDADPVILDVMDEWKAAIDAHDPSRVAAVFTEDAVFQGLRPYGVGRDAVAAYYDSQPAGMAVTYRSKAAVRQTVSCWGIWPRPSLTPTGLRRSWPSAWCSPGTAIGGRLRSTRHPGCRPTRPREVQRR